MATAPHTVDTAVASSPYAQPATRESPLASGLQLWHLLSFDAPSVAMLWTWFLARTNHIVLPATSVLAMGIAVWLLYAADRLLDTRATGDDDGSAGTLSGAKDCHISYIPPEARSADLEPRHYFHRRHQRAFRLGILIASIALALMLPGIASQSVHLYLVLGTLLFSYFVLIHVNTSNSRTKAQRLPKELAVGVFFSAATFIPTVARAPELRFALLPGAILFAVLCSLNCLFIYAWEHHASSPQAHPATRTALRWLPHLAVTAALAGILLSIADRSLAWPIPLSCSIATLLLLVLHKNSQRLSATTLRAAADLCLLSPLLLLRF